MDFFDASAEPQIRLRPQSYQRTLRVLLVEDDPDAAALTERRIGNSIRATFHVEHVETFSEALRAIEDKRYDVVILDLGLPDSDQLATVGVASLLTPHVPVLVLSSNRDEAVRSRASRAGVRGVLAKGTDDDWSLARLVHHAAEPSALEA